jgi:hypothetical protein
LELEISQEVSQVIEYDPYEEKEPPRKESLGNKKSSFLGMITARDDDQIKLTQD